VEGLEWLREKLELVIPEEVHADDSLAPEQQ
jgi:hypothetical protein